MAKAKKERPQQDPKRPNVVEEIDQDLEEEELSPAEAGARDADESFKDHRDALLEAFRSYAN